MQQLWQSDLLQIELDNIQGTSDTNGAIAAKSRWLAELILC
ncbi:hypothetical protein [Paenibacillus assamensis]|nr:hypothetical protein [Paenibacillus assamensis]